MTASDEKTVIIPLRPAPSSDSAVLIEERRPASRVCDAADPLRGLLATIENEIIPRLLLSHLPNPCDSPEGRLADECLRVVAEELTDVCAVSDLKGAREIADRLLNDGLPLEQLLLRVFAESARILGRRWEADQCDFLCVTLASGCLQSLMHELADDYSHEMDGLASERRILLLPTPGEAHGFGIAMVAEVFRRRGWHVDAESVEGVDQLVRRVREEWFHVVGLSVSGEQNLPRLAEAVRLVRAASRNRRVGLMVGGALFQTHPDWLSRVGADVCSHDALHAVEQAEHLIGLLVQAR